MGGLQDSPNQHSVSTSQMGFLYLCAQVASKELTSDGYKLNGTGYLLVCGLGQYAESPTFN